MALIMNLYRIFFLLIVLLSSSCCFNDTDKTQNFRPSQVSCTDKSSPDLRNKMESLKYRPGGDLYYLAFADLILADYRKLADMGSAKGMYMYGVLIRELMSIELGNDSKYDILYFDKRKVEIINALTYLYLASYISAKLEEKDRELLPESIYNIEKKIPDEWINEAKTNLHHWVYYCNKKSDR